MDDFSVVSTSTPSRRFRTRKPNGKGKVDEHSFLLPKDKSQQSNGISSSSSSSSLISAEEQEQPYLADPSEPKVVTNFPRRLLHHHKKNKGKVILPRDVTTEATTTNGMTKRVQKVSRSIQRKVRHVTNNNNNNPLRERPSLTQKGNGAHTPLLNLKGLTEEKLNHKINRQFLMSR